MKLESLQGLILKIKVSTWSLSSRLNYMSMDYVMKLLLCVIKISLHF